MEQSINFASRITSPTPALPHPGGGSFWIGGSLSQEEFPKRFSSLMPKKAVSPESSLANAFKGKFLPNATVLTSL